MAKYSYEEIDVCYLANGTKYTMSVHQFEGEPGEIFGVNAAIHGDEIIGVEICRRLVDILKNEENIHGTIKIMPVVNSLAFEEVNRCTPIDRANLNRVFPGSPNGMFTDRLADAFLNKFVYTCDYLVDLHSGGREPVVDYVYIKNDEALSRAFGSKILYHPDTDYAGSVGLFAVEHGVKYVTVEIGGLYNREEHIVRGVEGVLNMMRLRGFLDGEVKVREDQIVITNLAHPDSHEGGLMVPVLKEEDIGTIIKGRQLMARIYNPKTFELLEELYLPFEENLIVLVRPSVNRIHPGDFSFMIGEMATAE